MNSIWARARSARVIQRFVAAATVVGRVSKRTLVWLAVTLLGRWQWQRPAWVSFTAGHRYAVRRAA